MLKGIKIIIGITGSIAAYKAAFLIRLLVKEGAEVKVVTTDSANEFITPLTLSTLSKNPVYSQFTSDKESGTWTNHVELGLWADIMLIAPATANTLAKMTHGVCDNLLMAVYLSAKCPVWVAPAMDLDMYRHFSTLNNIKILKENGVRVLESAHGELASGLVGEGRMQEPEDIVDSIKDFFNSSVWANQKVLITAGPTYEAIDPVRFIGNHSSGKMGYELAKEAAKRGADVVLVSGPSSQVTNHPNIRVISVVSAQEMHEAVIENYTEANVIIASAAVADYRPKHVAVQKMKKKDSSLQIELEPTTDILADLGSKKQPNQLLIGFALETENELDNAKGKLTRKNLDFIVLNSLNNQGAGFKHDTNQITIIDKNTKTTYFELKSKEEVAHDILNTVEEFLG